MILDKALLDLLVNHIEVNVIMKFLLCLISTALSMLPEKKETEF